MVQFIVKVVTTMPDMVFANTKIQFQERIQKGSGFRHRCLIFPSKLGPLLNQ